LVQGALLLLAPSMPVVAIGLWWNSNTISHNFVHLPFFRSGSLNALYSLYLTILLGIPQTLWRERHLAHHNGTGGHRPPLQRLWRAVTVAEIALVLGLWSFLLYQARAFFLTTYIPGYAIGLGLCFVHGYFEHLQGTTSNYGFLYNFSFLNDGYHVEHHLRPGDHWTRLPKAGPVEAKTSKWPAVFRWIEVFNLELLERLVLHSKTLQRFLLRTHERAIRTLLRDIHDIRDVKIVGGGMFPRTALILEKLLPDAEITVVDKSDANLQTARKYLSGRVKFVNATYEPSDMEPADLLVIPLAFVGNRNAIYGRAPARITLIHDWAWSRHRAGVSISLALLKRLNLVRR